MGRCGRFSRSGVQNSKADSSHSITLLRFLGRSLFLPFHAGARDLPHLGGDLVEQRHVVLAFIVKIEVSAIGKIGEVRLGAEAFEDSFKLVRRSVEIERVSGSHHDMNAALEILFALSPCGFDDMGQVVVIAPIGHHVGMYLAG